MVLRHTRQVRRRTRDDPLAEPRFLQIGTTRAYRPAEDGECAGASRELVDVNTLGEVLLHGGDAGEGLDEPYEGAALVCLGEGIEVDGLGADAGFGGDFDTADQLPNVSPGAERLGDRAGRGKAEMEARRNDDLLDFERQLHPSR
jgi:hypothetical protein